MSTETKKTRTPRLRFPEFREAGEWKETKLGDVLIFQTGYPFDSAGFSEGNGIRLVRNRDLKSDDKIVYYDKLFEDKFLVDNGDILVGMDGDFTPCLWCKGKALLNQRVGRVFVKSENCHNFLYHFLAIHLKEIEENTARTTVKHLSHSDIEKINKPFPSPPEQQKIAALLTSLDALIAAQGEKISALQAHKKGLMQRLFPAEGERVPRVRFGEFEGEWEEKELGKITTWGSGGTPSKDNPEYWGGNIPWISASSMRGIKYSDSKLKLTEAGLKNGSRLAKKDSLLLLVRGSMLFNCVPVGIAGKDVAFNQDLKSIAVSKEVDTKYLLYWFLASEQLLMSMVGGTGIGAGKLETSELQKISVPLPALPEQQKIASLLTALDDLIAAQGEKLEALKAQKKGLMQGVFPGAG